MKQVFRVKPHSQIDVITNSSSEIFILKSDKSLETIKEMLRALCDFDGTNSFEGTFGDIYIIETEEQALRYAETIVWFKMHYDVYRYLGSSEYSWEEEQKRVKEWVKQYVKDNDLIGSIVIESNGDNSIPWGIVEFIEYSLHAERTHLG